MNCPKCFTSYVNGVALCDCQLGINQGWQCPICESVYAPEVKECKYCNKPKINVTSPKDIITY